MSQHHKPTVTQISAAYTGSPSGLTRPVTLPIPAVTSSVNFVVHAGMDEVQALARERGWFDKGFTTLSIPWTELHWTLDGWKTQKVVRSTDVPCPVVDGDYMLANVAPGVEVEFAVHAGVSCHAPHDTKGARDSADLWFNNHTANYRQVTT